MTLELPKSAAPRQMISRLSVTRVETAVEKCTLRLGNEIDFYQQGIPLPTSYYMMGGSAVHAVIEWALKEVIFGRPLPSAKDCHDRFPASWEEQLKEAKKKGQPIEEDPDDPPELVKEGCHALVPFARDTVLTRLKPKIVEHDFREPIPYDGGKAVVSGRIDYIEQGGQILDWKTTKKVSANARKFGIQMKGYGWWDGKVNGAEVSKVSKIFFIRGKKPAVDKQDYSVLPVHREAFRHAAVEVWKAVQSGILVPNTGTFWCSQDWCPFWASCPYGGGE